MRVVEYAVATGLNITAEQASDGLFPGMRVVLVGSEVYGRTRTFWFLVEQPDGPLELHHHP